MHELNDYEEMIDMEELTLIWLREDIGGELDAINQYQDHIDAIANEEVKRLLEHIRDEEKEHVAELVKLLRKLDKVQDDSFKKEGL